MDAQQASSAQLWRAVVPFKGNPNEGQLCFLEGDIITLLLMDQSGWWEGIFQGKRGRFPASCIVPYVGDKQLSVRPFCIAMQDHVASRSGQLSFRRGDVIYLKSKPKATVWSGKLATGQEGTFPSELVYEPQKRKDSRSSTPSPIYPRQPAPSMPFTLQQPLIQQPVPMPIQTPMMPTLMPMQQTFQPMQQMPQHLMYQQPQQMFSPQPLQHTPTLYPTMPLLQQQPQGMFPMQPQQQPFNGAMPPQSPQQQAPPPKPAPSPQPAQTASTSTATSRASSSLGSQCCICYEGTKEAVCIPCGHIAMCMKCSSVVMNGRKVCPICRSGIESVCKAFIV